MLDEIVAFTFIFLGLFSLYLSTSSWRNIKKIKKNLSPKQTKEEEVLKS